MKSGVYIIQNLVNNKCYIGASQDALNRLWDHKTKLRGNYHINEHLQAAFNLYGESNFIFEILESYEDSLIFSFENYWCNILNTHDRRFGYNIDPTSPHGKCAISIESRIKMGENRKDKREIHVYTVYGQSVDKFKDLYACGRYFGTAAANIHRKMNILLNKKNLIDSLLSKHILTDKDIDISIVRDYWNTVFKQIQNLSGDYKVEDCFGNLIGNGNIRDLAKILNILPASISKSIIRGTYIKTLKISK